MKDAASNKVLRALRGAQEATRCCEHYEERSQQGLEKAREEVHNIETKIGYTNERKVESKSMK